MTRKPAMTAQQVRDYIMELDAGNPNRNARIRVAELAIAIGNVSDEGKAVYREYIEQQRAMS